MSLLRVSIIDKQITKHLQLGGSLDDPIGKRLIHYLMENSLAHPNMKEALSASDLSADLMKRVYKEMVDETMPNPLIDHGGNLIAATLPFMDEDNFGGFIADILQGTHDLEGDEREAKILANSRIAGKRLHILAIELRGQPSFVVNEGGKGYRPKGCAATLMVGVVIAVVVIALVKGI